MIKSIKAKEILNSRIEPTVKVELKTEKGVFEASVPSGASTGKYETKELSSLKAIRNIEKIIAPKLIGKDEIKQEEIDNILIKNKNLGANAILPVSIAVCRAGAVAKNLPLYKYIRIIGNWKLEIGNWRMPRPCFNIINGGAHADNNLDIQEFMIVPNYSSCSENLESAKKVFERLKKDLDRDFGEKGIKMGDEGGFAPPIDNDKEALEYIFKIIKDLKINIGLDCAASQFYFKNKYIIDHKRLETKELLDFYQELIKKYPIIFIEDPFSEDDWKSWQRITKKLAKKISIIGDDLLTTNIKRIEIAKKRKACNGMIIKPNQIGTVTETLKAVKLAKSYKWKIIVSHRSGETMDDFIADLAVGVRADFLKSGAPSKLERLSKYNRLLKIKLELKKGA